MSNYELVQNADFYNVNKILIEIHPDILGAEKFEFVKRKLVDAGFQINEQFSSSQEFFLECSNPISKSS